MKIFFLIFAILAIKVFGDICEEGEKQKLTKGLYMKCIDGEWVKVEKRKSGPGGPPCTDDPSKSCSADQGHCSQYTVKGAEMDRDCPGTCESCDGCNCQDDNQWHKYCPFWKQFCGSAGVLGNWMTTNCRKTCGECKCKCCSYQGKQHKLGATIELPEKCGQLICEESMVAGYSPLLPGATAHNVTHPEELTLNFYSVHGGADCCILPGSARSADGSSVANGTMVAEGWSGELSIRRGRFSTTCCHGVLCVPLGDASALTTATTTTSTSTSTTTSTTSISTLNFIPRNNDQCNRAYTVLNQDWRKVKYTPAGASPCYTACDKHMSTGWYRFKEPAGFKLPIIPPASFGKSCDVCGTSASAWVQERRDPVYGEGVIDINICYAWSSECSWTKPGQAVACKDDAGATHYLYYLTKPPFCTLAYCAIGA